MKTIADFKRRLKPGVKVETIYHQNFAGRTPEGVYLMNDKNFGVRECSIVQSNSFAFKTEKSNGTTTDSWCNWPKKSECKFIDENTIQIFSEDFRSPEVKKMIPCLTYKFI